MSFQNSPNPEFSSPDQQLPTTLPPNYFDDLKQSLSPPEQVTSSSDPVLHRLDLIEANLNKICSQHDALMPLLLMKEQLPMLNKTENTIKGFQKKINENDEKLRNIEKSFKTVQNDFTSDMQRILQKKNEKTVEIPNIDKPLKGFSNQINNLQSNLKEIESRVLNLQKITENKLKDEELVLNREVDKMVEGNKHEIQNMIAEFKNKIELELKKQEEVYRDLRGRKSGTQENPKNLGILDKDKLIEDIHNITSAKIDGYIENIKSDYEKDVNELNKKFGGLRCEMEMLYDQNRKEQVLESLKSVPKNADINEKKFRINNMEQSLFLGELEKFNNENSQRINYELMTLEEKIDGIRADLQAKTRPKETIIPIKQETEFLEDRFSYVKYQIEGAKKKYLYDMKRIEEKMDKLNIMRKKMLAELQNHISLKPEINLVETFPEKIKRQMESINSNLELSYKKLKEVDEKLAENKELLRKSSFS